jgi:hypothetical protein
MPRGKRGRRYLPDLSFSVEEWERIEEAQWPAQAPEPALARQARRPAGRSSPPARLVRDLSEDQVQRLRSAWAASIVRPHRLPWQPPELDLADLPCACTAEAACALHQQELGGRRPYVR